MSRTATQTCCNRDLRNQPQVNAVGAAALIFLSGGMFLAWSIGFNSYNNEFIIGPHLRISWFIAAIFGAAFGFLLSQLCSYKLLVEFSSLLVLIGGIVTTVGNSTFDSKSGAGPIFAANYMNGIANGLIFAPTLAMAGELSVCYKRGSIASAIEQWPTTLGIFVQIVCAVSRDPEDDYRPEHVQGIVSIICGIIGICLAYVWSIESPVELLRANDEQGAIDVLSKLQCPRAVTAETYHQLTEHRLYLAQNQALSEIEAWQQSLPALVRLCLIRGLYASSNSMLVAYTLSLTSTIVYGDNSGPHVLFGFFRLVGSCLCAFSLDSLGRKIPLLMGLIVCGGMSIGLASRFTIHEFVRTSDMRTALWLLLISQLFSGIAFAPSSAYLSEAFPLSVKRPCIALAYTVEMIIHLGINSVVLGAQISDNVSAFFFSIGALQLIGFLLSVWYMPETKLITLRQAQDIFRHFVIGTTEQPILNRRA
ncbi:uncharacterized protein Dwil_GK24100 [Drosophila willistoni]|uniref:Major facilitator superfamily (MFS) profile domain-containing protein n=2 Tax=Drosophila willistoni TaxID=7260 RepID=B4N6U0_DROWI|nr:uncharacterized protein Dwil_GK24100 [Drosophila willistoni]